MLDAVLTGAKGVNLWASFRTPPPQRSARLYQALVNTGLASGGQRRPGADAGAVSLHDLGDGDRRHAARRGSKRPRSSRSSASARDGITPQELVKAKTQLRARLVFENDSITNIAHQLGYFETIASWRLYPSIASASRR